MKIKDVMTRSPITVSHDASYKHVAEVLLGADVGAVPVIDDRGDVVGIISETDIMAKPAYTTGPQGWLRRLFGHNRRWTNKARGLDAAKLMSHPVITAAPSDRLEDAARRLMDHRIGRLPVIEDGKLVGIVARRDLLGPFGRPDSDIAAEISERLADPVSFERGHNLAFTVHDGVVTVTGTTTYPYEIDTVESVLADVAGVVDIDLHVTADQPHPDPGSPHSPIWPSPL